MERETAPAKSALSGPNHEQCQVNWTFTVGVNFINDRVVCTCSGVSPQGVPAVGVPASEPLSEGVAALEPA